MNRNLFARSRSGVGPGACNENGGAVYGPVGTDVSRSARSGDAVSNDEVSVRRQSDTALAARLRSGACDIPKYIVPPFADSDCEGSARTGSTEYAQRLPAAAKIGG